MHVTPEAPDEKDEFYLDILDGVARYLDDPFISDMVKAVSRYRGPYIANSLNKNQMASKTWLIDELHRATGCRHRTGYVLGGWNGVLGALLLRDPRLNFEKLLSIDIDPDCQAVAETMNAHQVKSGRFSAITGDMFDVDYGDDLSGDILFNTSCEHLENLDQWYGSTPQGMVMVLQSNDLFDEEEHVNCVADLDAFKRQVPMAELMYAGELKLKRYTRFMVIGRR